MANTDMAIKMGNQDGVEAEARGRRSESADSKSVAAKANRVQDQSLLKWIADFIWNIADDRLRDVYVRGKYRNGIRTDYPNDCDVFRLVLIRRTVPSHEAPPRRAV